MEFKKTYVAPFNRSSDPVSDDVLYWKNFSSPILLKEVNSIEYIDVSPVEPHFAAVTCSARIQLYHPVTRMVHKNYNRFKEAAHGGVFRNDGKLLLAGSDEGVLRLFDVASKHLLRVYKGHQRSVHRCSFMPADHQVVSFSDDKNVILWDMASEAILHTFEGHSDYVRCGGTVVTNPDLIVSGSYDHSVKVWDKRDKKEVISVNHGAPVESLLVTANGSLLFTAGLTEIKVWDLMTGGRLLAKISQHHKTITCLRFASEGKRLLSASLDRHVKVYDMTSFEVIHSYNYSSPILSLGISPGDKTMLVGMTDGILAISRKEESPVLLDGQARLEPVPETKIKKRKSRTYADYTLTEHGAKDELLKADKKYDVLLRKFRYSKALDEVLSDFYFYKSPAVSVALIQELMRRDGLKSALAGRSGKQLLKVLRFLVKHLRKPRFMRILMHVTNCVSDLYISKVGEDPKVDEMFIKLYEEVEKETKYMQALMEVKGSLDLLLAGSSTEGISSVVAPVQEKLYPSLEAQQAVIVSLK